MEIKEYIAQYKYKTELHTHTYPVSRCADICAADTVRIYVERGADSLVITNHIFPEIKDAEKYLSDYYKAREAGEKYGVKVILGAEMRFAENSNDYLVYGIDESDIAEMIKLTPYTIRKFYSEMKNERNVILQAHPFRPRMVLAPLDSIDGIESFNLHSSHNSKIGFAARYARDNGLLVAGGSDFHHKGHEAVIFARSKERLEDSFDVARLIKSRDYLFDISGSVIFPYADV